MYCQWIWRHFGSVSSGLQGGLACLSQLQKYHLPISKVSQGSALYQLGSRCSSWGLDPEQISEAVKKF